MSRERLRLYMRRRQFVDDTGNVVVKCNPDGSAEYVPGLVDQTWQEFTDVTTGLDQVSLGWDKSNSGSDTTEANEVGSNYDKGISLNVTFYDAAYQFLNAWLDTPCGILNAVEVKIEDALCKKNYRIFEVKADNLTDAPVDAPCQYEVRLREADAAWHCIHKTFIWDNWQNWFKDGSTKQHPCFLTAIEPRPRLVNSARAGLALFWQTIPKTPAIPLPQGNDVMRRILNVDNFVDAPLVRDIFTNGCQKCGLGVDTMFHDPGSPYYNLCLYYPLSGAVHVNDSGSVTANALWYHFENRWNITIAEFADHLKGVFEAEWYVTPNNTFVFQPLASFQNTAPIHDFTAVGALPLYGLRYTFNGKKKPAFGRYEYTLDGADLASHEVIPLYNDIVDYDGPANNLMLEGSRTKTLEFAATGFVRDGKARADYLRDILNDAETVAYAVLIILVVVIFALAAGILSAGAGAALAAIMAIWAINIANRSNTLRNNFGSDIYTGAVRITADELAQPRLILWDGVSLNRAKAVKADPATLTPNTYYNPNSLPYNGVNKFQYNPAGGLFVFNFPMYFDSMFTGNLYDRFHDAADNPMKSTETHREFECYTDLCCEAMDMLGVWEGDFAKIGYFIILEQRNGFQRWGRIEHFELNYRDERIHIKGRVYNKIV